MKFFVDTAEIADIRDLAATGLLDGVTTNPSIILKSGRNILEVTKEICSIVSGPVSAEVTATDIAGGLVEIAARRAPSFLGHGKIDWRVGDMIDDRLGMFDHVVAMDSLIHYREDDLVATLEALGERCSASILFTFAPYTPLLGAMHRVGKLFPRGDRSPAIVPISEERLRRRLPGMRGWRVGRTARIASGFYTSQAMELVRR